MKKHNSTTRNSDWQSFDIRRYNWKKSQTMQSSTSLWIRALILLISSNSKPRMFFPDLSIIGKNDENSPDNGSWHIICQNSHKRPYPTKRFEAIRIPIPQSNRHYLYFSIISSAQVALFVETFNTYYQGLVHFDACRILP